MNPYSRVPVSKPGRSVFNLSYSKLFTCDMGQIIPVACDEAMPGDFFTLGFESVVRFMPLVGVPMTQVDMYVYSYFCPYRKMFDDFEDFITGGVDGKDATALPEWNPTNTAVGSPWDFFGFPVGVVPTGALPLDFPRLS